MGMVWRLSRYEQVSVFARSASNGADDTAGMGPIIWTRAESPMPMVPSTRLERSTCLCDR
jgi:hypothetical protein